MENSREFPKLRNRVKTWCHELQQSDDDDDKGLVIINGVMAQDVGPRGIKWPMFGLFNV